MTTRILIIDEHSSLREQLELAATATDLEFVSAATAEEAFERLEATPVDVVFADALQPGLDGQDLLPQLVQRLSGGAVIAVAPREAPEIALEALERGAYDSITKPVARRTLAPLLRRLRERDSLRRQNALLQRDLARATGDPPIVAASEAMIELLEGMERAAGFGSGAFLVGETGTGKETLARAIHAQSPRRRGAFVAVQCGSVPEAEFESLLFGSAHTPAIGLRAKRSRRGLLADADGGTLFLDEVGRLTLDTQSKILRVLEQEEWSAIGDSKARRIDVRVIAASSRDLSADVAAGRFLPELLERLSVHRLAVPSLRERSKDIPLLFDHYLAHFRNTLGRPVHSISDDALEQIVYYAWPGNTRELANLVECAVILADGPRITATELPDRLAASTGAGHGERPHSFALKPARKALEARIIRRALRATDGNRTHAAKLLDISHRALLYKIKEFGIRDLPPRSGH